MDRTTRVQHIRNLLDVALTLTGHDMPATTDTLTALRDRMNRVLESEEGK